MTWFLGGLMALVVGWAIRDKWREMRRQQRDKYAEYNEGR